MSENELQSKPTPRVPLGGDYWSAAPGAPLWGFADLHAHLMAHLAFGGQAFWGQPYDPDHFGEEGMQVALASCEPIHGGLINVNPEFGHPASGGWPEFIVWPRFTTLVHQQAYVDWLYRAYQGGLRLITCLAVNNELLATKSSPGHPHDDKSAIQAEIVGMKEMVERVNRQSEEAGQGKWLQIAYSSDEARQIVAENRLAVILGVEVDSLGNWRTKEDLERASEGSLEKARQLIGAELDWLHSIGVRQITPIHLTNNAFGGTAIYLRFLEMNNLFVTGERWTVVDSWETGVRYRLDHDGADLLDDVERTVAVSGQHLRPMHRRTLLDHIPGIHSLYDALALPKITGGHANTRGLNQYGHILLEEMIARGIIIDVDHMSEKTTDEVLSIAEQSAYPVICSHTWFRDLLFSGQTEFDPLRHEHYGTSDVHKVAHEAGKRGDQIDRIGKLGGVVAPILNQGDIAGLRRALPEQASKINAPCAGTSTSWAEAYLYASTKMGGRGVAMGSDINGAACLPGPRFGTFAAYGVHHDARRLRERRAEIDQQANGVAYNQPIRDHRWYRFEPSGPDGYSDEERHIWQAVAQYEAGFNPLLHSHPLTDFPEPKVREALELNNVRHSQQKVDDFTRGFWLAEIDSPPDFNLIATWPIDQQAGYLSRREIPEAEFIPAQPVRELTEKVKAIQAKWRQMQGSNPPLQRCTAGPRRDFDFNLDGMAHYGLIPDFLQDVRNVGLTPEDLAPLFRSAYDYVQMWHRCEQRSEEIQKANSAPASNS